LQIRKRLLVKIFSSVAWEKQLVEFVEVFANRRKELELALMIHTTVGVDEANLKLTIICQITAELSQKYVSRM